ncbi:hypothetical protein CL617_02915 [archaeon]|nr:hypothetical protein [archaeon]|tara:strand:+ start:2716 stop:3612 length:897 start_codon:yes stop_codon:yes gene_type:complete
MADNDIYNSMERYEKFKRDLDKLVITPNNRKNRYKRKYYCKNKENLKYYRMLFDKFEAKDLSYIRRYRLLVTMKIITYATDKDLKECDRDDIDKVMGFMHTVYLAKKSKEDFIRDIKYMWKMCLPDKDEKGRIDETRIPYPVRHIKNKIEKAKEKLKQDRFSIDEFEKIVNYFGDDPKMQCYLNLALESLGRPQELCYIRLKDVELKDNYAKIWLSSHTKTGVGFLQCIDSYRYLANWLSIHPFKKDPEAYLFVRYDKRNPKDQLNPKLINAKLRTALNNLGINKPITCYSLKRNGVI